MDPRGGGKSNEAALRRLELLAREVGGRGTAVADDEPFGDALDELGDDLDEDGLGPWPGGMLPAAELPARGAPARARRPFVAVTGDEADASWGRHRSGGLASRPPRAWADAPSPLSRSLGVLGDGVRGRHVGVALLVVLLAAAGAAWWVLRAQPEAVVAEPAAPVAGSGSAGAEAVGSGGATAGSAVPSVAATTAAGEVVVDVAGRVRRPGIVTLSAGSRVADAITAAGGARRGTDLTSVNLARVLVDGEQIVVGLPAVTGLPGASPTGGSPGGSGAGATTGGPVNLNTATLEQLDTLPQVGPVTAQAILDWRTEHGRFTTVEELLEVRGIGDATLARLRDLVTV
ncbi:helix-hairpin-helix domain-containing protein [Mumia sp. DW29H23]|uniref:helix-hairpin-helix domain-containing protein n=1 Tax=Mumia sp. DW29H23 TaxID=3421241 RepID=UPI003D6858C1